MEYMNAIFSKKIDIPNDIFEQLQFFSKKHNINFNSLQRDYQRILMFFDGPLRHYHAINEIQNHYFKKKKRDKK